MTIGLLAARSPDLATHTALFGPLPNSLQPGTLTCLLADAELAGKGGSGVSYGEQTRFRHRKARGGDRERQRRGNRSVRRMRYFSNMHPTS